MKGAFVYTLVTIFCIYFSILIVASLPDSRLTFLKDWAGGIAAIMGIVVGGVRYFKASYHKTMSRWEKE